MKCHQCERASLYQVGGVSLCLECYRKVADLQHMEFLKNAILLNQALNEMDTLAPFGPISERVPIGEFARAMQKAPTFNNIQITGSQVGVVNTGDLAKIDAAVTISKGSDTELIGQSLARLAEAVMAATDLNDASKREIIELLNAFSQEAVRERKGSVLTALLESIRQKAAGAVSVAGIIGDLWRLVERFTAGS